jgi:AcrR family transcriptional regulator
MTPAHAICLENTMDNPTRSERTRTAAIKAAMTILERDGPGKLTFDAIAREAGISKGGLTHQFPSKSDVLTGLLTHQRDYFEQFGREYLAAREPGAPQPTLSTQIAIMREVLHRQPAGVLAILTALMEDRAPLQMVRDTQAENIKQMTAESTDPDLAVLRWQAAWGLVLTSMLGFSSLTDEDRTRLFERLLDEKQWAPR